MEYTEINANTIIQYIQVSMTNNTSQLFYGTSDRGGNDPNWVDPKVYTDILPDFSGNPVDYK